MPSSPGEACSIKLAREMKGWASIELKVRAEGTNHILAKGHTPHFTNSYHYIETNHGQRMMDAISRASTDLPGARYSAFCDGSKCANIIYRGEKRQDRVTIGRSFDDEEKSGSTSRPMPFSVYYVGKVPLLEAVQKGRYLGEGRVEGRKSLVFLFPKVKWAMAIQDLVYDLDQETSIPIRLRSFLGNLDENDVDGSQPAWTWTALSVDTVQGFHMPLRSSMVSYGGRNAAASDKRRTLDLTIESLQYNKKYPKETFWPVIQPGVEVINSIEKTQYVIPGGEREGPGQQEAAALSSAPASQPADWSGWASTAGFGVGSALLLFGLVSRWRRQRG